MAHKEIGKKSDSGWTRVESASPIMLLLHDFWARVVGGSLLVSASKNSWQIYLMCDLWCP